MSKKMIRIIRQIDYEKQYLQTLLLDQDYYLASLYYAMQQNDEDEVLRCKKLLKSMQRDIEYFKASIELQELRRGKQS